MIELLAPAGNEKSFFSAINNGANAVYIGLSDFSARKNADNFNTENLKYYISYAHLFNVKVYVAVNTLVKDSISKIRLRGGRRRFYLARRIFIPGIVNAFSRYYFTSQHTRRHKQYRGCQICCIARVFTRYIGSRDTN